MKNLHLKERLLELPCRIKPFEYKIPHSYNISREQLNRIKIIWPKTYEWDGSIPIVSAIKDGLMNLGVVESQHSHQQYKGVIKLIVFIDKKSYSVSLDYYDHSEFINIDALDTSDLYIKLQYRKTGYNDARIIPGGYPVTNISYYKYYEKFRNKYRNNRQLDISGRFGYTFQKEIRLKGVELLKKNFGSRYQGATGKIRYSHFLREVASSKLGIHFPGNGPFTHRVAEFLGLGTCMVSLRFSTELHSPLIPGKHYVEVSDDLSDLIEKCEYYLENDEERETIAIAGSNFFEQQLHRDEMAAYLVKTLLSKLV